MSNTPTQSRPETQSRTASTHTHHRGNPTLDHPDVHVATQDDYSSVEAMITALLQQEIRDPLNDENCCDGGDHGFRTYKTDLPVIRSEDIVPGQLIYRPTTSPLHVYEIVSEPYVNEHGARTVDVLAHSRSHAGEDPTIRTREQQLSFHKERIPPFTAGVNPTLTDQSTDDTLAGYSKVIHNY